MSPPQGTDQAWKDQPREGSGMKPGDPVEVGKASSSSGGATWWLRPKSQNLEGELGSGNLAFGPCASVGVSRELITDQTKNGKAEGVQGNETQVRKGAPGSLIN